MAMVLVIVGFFVDQTCIDRVMELMRCHYSDSHPAVDVKTADLAIPAHSPRMIKDASVQYDRDDIVIGDEPAETLHVSGYFYNQGDIIVINDGVLDVNNADFNLNGNIYAIDHGTVMIDSSTCSFLQQYIYHHIIFTCDSAQFWMTHSETYFNGYPINVSVQGSSQFNMDHITNHDWITAGVGQDACVYLNYVDITGEWLFIDDCEASFSHVNTLLTWYFFGDSATVDLAFPLGDTVYGFFIDSTLGNVQGVGYHVEIDSSTDCMWAAIPLGGSDVTIRDSELRVTGIMFQGADTFTVAGLVNGLYYNDFLLPLPDRVYHLLNTSVQTWNLYPSETSYVELSSSIFGELCGFDNSVSLIQNAFCDGSGGHIEASSNAIVAVYVTSIFADVISKGRGICVLGYCAMPMGMIWPTGASIMIIVNTTYPEDPVPLDTSIVFCAAINSPSNAGTDDSVGIVGSAWIDAGPYNGLDFAFYRLSYRLLGDSIWSPVGDEKYDEVRRDTLDYWNTTGLTPGLYEIRLVLKDTPGDSVEALKQIRLRVQGIVSEPAIDETPRAVTVRHIGPRFVHICCQTETPDIRIYDALGRQVIRMESQETYWHVPAGGVYFLHECTSGARCKIVAY